MKIIVGQHKLEIVKEPVNEREIDISKCEFEFDEAITSEYVKEAYFTLEGNTYKQIILNDECDIPSEVLVKKGTVEIGVVAFLVENEEEIKRYNPSPAYFNTWVGSLKDNAENSEPITPSEMEQYEQALQEGLSEVNSKLDEIDQAIEDVNQAVEDAEEAVESTNNLNIDVNKVDKTTQVDLTKKDGTTKTVYINDGTSLQFMWQGTSLGIKTDDMEEYVFVNLQGIQGQPGPQGEPFRIKKEYASVAEMNADFDNMNVGDYVMIASTVEVEDNAKLYVKGDSQWIFITDFSGAQGIKGETGATPIIRIGTVTSGSTPSVTISGTAEEPVFNFVLQPGEKGEKGDTGLKGDTGNGIASIVKTASAGLIDTYTITFTDGTTTTFNITNGQDGDVTQEYVDEENERLKSVFNVLPKVNGSGKSVTLENTGDTMLYKMDLKGNTSQEVVSGEVGLEVEDTSIYVDDVNESKENYITLKGNTSQSIKGNTSQSILPSGYTQVDYIECTGTQYIDTGFKANTTTTKFVGAFTPTQKVTGALLGSRNNSTAGTHACNVFVSANGNFRVDWANGSSGTMYNYEVGTKYEMEITRGRLVINGTTQSFTNSSSVDQLGNFLIGNFNSNTTPYADGFVGYIHECKLYSNDVLIRDFIPAKRISDNVVGMYDVVTKTFFTNAGTGDFTYGNVVPTPDAPQEIEVVTGNNTINVTGKNLFDKDNANVFNSYWNSNTLFSNNDAKAIYISCKPNTTYTISKIANNTFRVATTNVIPANNVSTLSSTANHTATSITITTENNANYLWVNYYNKHNGDTGSYEDIMNSIQIEEGSTATTYEAYKGQTYPVNLGSIELCKIGTYQDRIYKNNGNWYKNSQISKVTLNGTEKWSYTSETFLTGSITNYKLVGENICISSHFISQKNVSSTSELLDKHIAFRNDSTKRLYIKDSDITSASDFTTWLSSNNVTIYYILSTPTDTQITDTTLVNQLNALYNATIYSTTHINTETSNLLPYINLKYNVVTASPSPEKASEVEVVKGNNTITISNEDGTKTQTYNITLGSLELCKIGDYQDYIYKDNGKWYKYCAIKKMVLKGSGDTQLYGDGGSNVNYWEYFRSNFVPGNGKSITNYFNQTIYSRVAIINSGTLYLRFPKNAGIDVSTNNLMNNWLSTHNTDVYYVLATPTTTQINDQLLVSQLDELQKAMSYYDKTIITQTNADKPFILDVVGIRDLQDIFNI